MKLVFNNQGKPPPLRSWSEIPEGHFVIHAEDAADP